LKHCAEIKVGKEVAKAICLCYANILDGKVFPSDLQKYFQSEKVIRKMKIREAKKSELHKIKKLYLQSFPKEERKLFSRMCLQSKRKRMEMMVILDGSRQVGLAITALYQDLVLLDYFAIKKEFQNKHYGSRALELLKERYQDRRLVLEIELLDENASNYRERVRRKQFYLKNGMKETGIYASLHGVPMELLTTGKQVSYEEYHAIYEKSIDQVFARSIIRLED